MPKGDFMGMPPLEPPWWLQSLDTNLWPGNATFGDVMSPAPGTPVPYAPSASPVAAPVADPSAMAAGPAAATGGPGALLKALQGVQMPKPPEVQRVGTPHVGTPPPLASVIPLAHPAPAPPQVRPAQGGQLMDLLLALGLHGGAQSGGGQLPSTLARALGR